VPVISSKKLIGTTEFNPQQKIRLKSVDGSIVEMHSLLKAQVQEGKVEIPIEFQLIIEQVDLEGDGILGKDFLQKMKAQIRYENKSVNFKWRNVSFENKLTSKGETNNREVRKITLPKRGNDSANTRRV
jgi:hypothetical protein